MTRRIALLLILIVFLVGSTASSAFSDDVELRESQTEDWDKMIALDLKQAEIRKVLELVFQIAGQPVTVDGCVEGAVSLKFENVSARDALESIVRMGDLRVRPMREGYSVDCGVDEPLDGPPVEGHLLEFTLTDIDRVVITRPSLLVHYDSLAEIRVGSVQTEDLDPAGDFFPGDAQPTIRLKAYLREDKTDSQAGQLRGIFEVAVRDDRQAKTMRMAAHSFELELPVGSIDVRVVALSLGEEEFELTVSRPAR